MIVSVTDIELSAEDDDEGRVEEADEEGVAVTSNLASSNNL